MRFIVCAMLVLSALPASMRLAAAQQLSPLTGTTATPPPGVASMPPAPGTVPVRPRGRFRDRFEAANTTHDGKLTLDQAQAGHMPQVVRYFPAIDSTHRGYVTLQDIQVYRRTQMEARRAARQAQPPQPAPPAQ